MKTASIPIWAALLFLTAFFLRVWKTDFGLPHIVYGDEGRYVYLALNMGSGDLNTKPYYPSLFFYLVFFAQTIYILFSWLTGHFKSLGEAWQLYQNDPTIFYVLARLVSAVFGTLTVMAAYFFSLKIFQKKAIAFLSAAFLAFSYLHVYYSRFAMLDIVLTFFITLSILAGALALQEGKLRYLILCGIAGGLAASTKFNGAMVFASGLLTVFLFPSEKRRAGAFFLMAFAAGFSIGTPYWILDFSNFIRDLVMRWSLYNPKGQGVLGMEGGQNGFHYLFKILPMSMGAGLTALGIMGLIFLLIRVKKTGLYWISFPAVYFFVAFTANIRVARYMLPVLPLLCIAAAFMLVFLFEILESRKIPLFRFALPLTVFLLLVPSVSRVGKFFALINVPDTRQMTYEWIRDNLSGKTFLQSFAVFSLSTKKDPFQIEDLDRTVFDTRAGNVSSLKSLQEYRNAGYEYVLLDEWHVGLIQLPPKSVGSYQDTFQRYEKFLGELESSATLLKEFSPYRKDQKFDPMDSEIPASSSLANLKNLGPWIRIYRI